MVVRLVTARLPGLGSVRAITRQIYRSTKATLAGRGAIFAPAVFLDPRTTHPVVNPFAPNLERPTDIRLDIQDVIGIIDRMTDVMLQFSSTKGREASEVRRAVGYLRAFTGKLLVTNQLAKAMANTFAASEAAGTTVSNLDLVLQQLLSETPSSGGPLYVTQSAMLFALASQCRIIANMTFVSRNDVDAVQLRMRQLFESVKNVAADSMDSLSYDALLTLGAALSRHLAMTARPLPQVVEFSLKPMPALALSQRIYYDGSRWEELLRENKTIHPAFMRRDGRALSA